MAFSDQTQFHVGDRVQDRQTGQTGRVIDLQPLADGTLLITVATFLYGIQTGKVQEAVRRGQALNSRFRKLTLGGAGAAQTIEITQPTHGTVSDRARQAAADNRLPGTPAATSEEKAARYAARHEQAALPRREAKVARLREELAEMERLKDSRSPGWDATRSRQIKQALARAEYQAGLPSRSLLEAGWESGRPLRVPDLEGNAERAVDALFEQSRFFHMQADRLRDQRNRIDELVGYVTRRRPNSEGVFAGSYLNDVLLAPKGQIPLHVLERMEHVEALLKGLPVDPGYVRNHPQFFRGEIRTAFDLLQQAHGHTLLEPTRRRQFALWREYGQLLSQAVQESKPYRTLEKQESRARAVALRRTELAHTHFYSDPIVADRFSPTLDSAGMGLVGRTEHQQYVLNRGMFPGETPTALDMTAVERDLARQKRTRLYQQAGVQLKGKRTGNNIPGVNLPDLFDLEKSRPLRGSLFRLNGQTVRFTGVEHQGKVTIPQSDPRILTQANALLNASRANPTVENKAAYRTFVAQHAKPAELRTIDRGAQAVFQPVRQKQTLYTSNFWARPKEQLGLLNEIHSRAALARDIPRPQATAMARAVASTRAVTLKGGLRGETGQMVPVPVHLLQGYLAGDLPESDRALMQLVGGPPGLQALGFSSTTELRTAAKAYGKQFGSRLFSGIPEASSSLIREVEGGDLERTVWAGAFLHLRTVPEGLSLGQLETSIIDRFQKPQALHQMLSVLGLHGPDGTPLSQIDTPRRIAEKMGRELTPDELLSVLKGKPVGAATSVPDAANAVTRPELKHLLRRFHQEMQQQARDRLGDTFHHMDSPLAQRALSRARRQVNRVDLMRRLFGIESDLTGAAGIAQVEALDELAEHAEDIARWLTEGKIKTGILNQELKEFAQAAGLELMRGNESLNEAWAAYARNPTAKTKRVYETIKSRSYQQRHESRYVRRLRGLQKQEEEFALADARIGKTLAFGQYTTPLHAPYFEGPTGRWINPQAEWAARLNPLIDLAEQGDAWALVQSEHDFVLEPGGGVAIKQYTGRNRTGTPYLYRRVGGPGSLVGEARNLTNPADVIGFGGPPTVTASRAELAAAQERGQFKPLWHEGHPLLKRRARALQKSAVEAELVREHGYVVRSDVSLPFWRAEDGTVVGMWEQGGIRGEAVAANTRELLENPAAFLSFDLETDIRSGRITNISAGKYRAKAGKLFSQGEGIDLALPSLWRQAAHGEAAADEERAARILKQRSLRTSLQEGQTLSAAERGITQHGRRTTIGSVVKSEREILRQAARYLEEHPEKIVGHNISFDIGTLIERAGVQGMEHELEIFENAQSRLVDTMLLSQAADPTAASHALEWLSQRHLGIRKSQAHLAGPDQRQAAALFAKLAENPEAIKRLSSMERQTLTRKQYLWDRENQFGFRVDGFLDPDATRERIRRATGADVQTRWGLLLNPVRFTDHGVSTQEVLEGTQTAHGFASQFTAKYELLSHGELQQRMRVAAEDLAGRRARRVLAGEGSFGELLREQERLTWLQGNNRHGATADLVHRWGAATSPAAKERLGRVHRWSGLLDGYNSLGEENAQANRLVAQMAHVDQFMKSEIEQHAPIVSWLADFVNAAEAGGIAQAERQASSVWNEYIARTRGIGEFGARAITIPEGRQRLGLELPVLGKTMSVRTAAPEMARRDMDRLTFHVARKLDQGGQLDDLFKSFAPGEVTEFKARLRADRMLLDNDLGQKVRQHIFERHLQPAMAAGFTQPDLAGDRFQVHATTPDHAIDQILEQGAEVVQRRVEAARDYLAGRHLEPTALAALQEEMKGKSVAQTVDDLDAIRRQEQGKLPDLFLSARHGVPHEWAGREVSDVLLEGKRLKGEPMAGFQQSMALLRQGMKGLERSLLDQKLTQAGFNAFSIAGKGPNLWEGAVPDAFRFAPTLGNAGRAFRPGGAVTAGLDLVDDMANQVGRIKGARNAGLALMGGAFLMAAVSRPKGPPPHGPTGKDAGLASTPGEVAERRERLGKRRQQELRSEPLTQQLRVRISGDDPVGVNHTELVQSVHQALGTYVQQEVSHAPEVRDSRAPINQDYMDRLGAHLLKRAK